MPIYFPTISIISRERLLLAKLEFWDRSYPSEILLGDPWRTFAIRPEAEHKRKRRKVFARKPFSCRTASALNPFGILVFCRRFAYKAGQPGLELSSCQTSCVSDWSLRCVLLHLIAPISVPSR